MMSKQWLLMLLGLSACILILALPVHAAQAPASSAIPCEPPSGNTDRQRCQPVAPGQVPTPRPMPSRTPILASGLGPASSVLPFTYAYVMTGSVALYASPADVESGTAPSRTLDAGYVWVRLMGWTSYKWQIWYLTQGGGYLPASRAAIYRPSAFKGIVVYSQPSLPFAWVLTSVKTSPQPGAKPDASSVAYKRYDLVTLYEERVVGRQTWYRVGDDQWVIQTVVAKVEWTPRPAGVDPGEKWISVSLFEQTLAAYEGDRMVYATLLSSGLPLWPTAQGLHRIHTKYPLDGMSGREGQPDYYSLEDVPWIMYYFQDYALHGAYWHDSFGYRHSHGCINLAPLDARWLYEWTTPAVAPGAKSKRATKDEPGTWVWVHP